MEPAWMVVQATGRASVMSVSSLLKAKAFAKHIHRTYEHSFLKRKLVGLKLANAEGDLADMCH